MENIGQIEQDRKDEERLIKIEDEIETLKAQIKELFIKTGNI